MSTIKITFTAVEAPNEAQIAQVCSCFYPSNSYVDTDPYDGTVYDTNVPGFGTWEGLVDYLSKITNAPNILIMFKAAVRDGEVEFEESDPKQVEYYKELGVALADNGFTVEVADSESAEG